MKDLETLPKKEESKVLASYEPSDEEDFDFIWDAFVSDVQTIIDKMRTTKFFAYGLYLTWRNVAGYTEFETQKATTVIRKLAPNSGEFSMTFKNADEKGVIEVTVSHHDKPMGETMYLMSQNKEKKLGIKEQYFDKNPW